MKSEVISTAPSSCTPGEMRGGGGGQKRTVAWDSERGRENRGRVVEIPLKLL